MCVSCFLRRTIANMTLLVALLASSSAEKGDIIEGPKPLNASLEEKVQYSCVVEGTILFWLIDGSSAFPPVTAGETNTIQISEDPPILSSNLTFKATSHVNQSSVECHSHVYSSVVTLFIQGPLAPVGNLAAAVVDNSSQTEQGILVYQLLWDAPYSLVGVPILGYRVQSVGLHLQSLTSTFFTTNTALLSVDVCDDYNVSVVPVNGAGDGDTAFILLHHVEAPSLLAADTVLTQPKSGELLVQADFTISIFHSCVGKVEDYIRATVNGDIQTFGPFLPTGNKIFFVMKELTRSQHYNISVWLENVNGKSNAIQMTLSTFAVQSINYSIDSQGSLCIECLFVSGLNSSGCIVVLSAASGQGSVMVHISRSNNELSATGCIIGFSAGVYNFTVYDVPVTGAQQDAVAYKRDNVMIVDDVTSTFVTTTDDPVTNFSTEITTPGNSIPTNFPILSSAIAVGIVVATLAVAVVIVAISYAVLRKRRSKDWTVNIGRTNSFLQRSVHEYEISHILHPRTPREQNCAHISTDVNMHPILTTPIPLAKLETSSVILENIKQSTTGPIRRSNSHPILSGGEQTNTCSSSPVTTPLRDASAAIVANPMALNTSITDAPPSYIDLALNPPCNVRRSSNTSEHTQRMRTNYETRSFDDPSQELNIHIGPQHHCQNAAERSQHNSGQHCNPTFFRQGTREVEYVQLDVSSLELRQPGNENCVADIHRETSINSERVQYSVITHKPQRHYHFHPQFSTGSLV